MRNCQAQRFSGFEVDGELDLFLPGAHGFPIAASGISNNPITHRVEDEGEYSESGSEQVLTKHMKAAPNAIEGELRKDPSAQSKVKTPDGRIMDLSS